MGARPCDHVMWRRQIAALLIHCEHYALCKEDNLKRSVTSHNISYVVLRTKMGSAGFEPATNRL